MNDPQKPASAHPSQRQYHRARIPLLVQYRFSPQEPYTTDYSADLSRGGMFIRTDKPDPIGTLMDLQFISRDGDRVIQGRGRIVRISEDAENPGQAIEFIGFSENDMNYLTKLVKQRLSEVEHNKLRVGRKSSRSTLKAVQSPVEANPLDDSDK